jgi:hypothetical protein
VLPVSRVDAGHFEKEFQTKTVYPIEIGINCPATPLAFEDANAIRLLFVGRLDWLPNREGLKWFLQSVWPKLKANPDRQFHLTVIGSGDSSWLEPLTEGTDVEFLKNVLDLQPYYRRAHATLTPLFMGSGTRVKAIESGAMARTFLSTRVGVEGLPFEPGKEFFQSDSADEWVDFLLKIEASDLKAMGEKAWVKTRENFERAHLAGKLNSVLGEFAAGYRAARGTSHDRTHAPREFSRVSQDSLQ